MTAATPISPVHDLLALASDQYGCFCTDQWRAHGLTDRQLQAAVGNGWVTRLSQRVYRVTGAPPTWHARVMAATLIAPGRVNAGWRTALRLHGLSAWHDPRPHVTIPHDLRYRADRRRVVVHTSRTLHLDSPTMVGPLQCVSVERALLEDGMHAPTAKWFDLVCEAVRRGLVTVASLLATLDSMGAIPNRRRMRDALGTVDPALVDARSVPEVSLLRLVEDVIGGKARLNHVVRDVRGRRMAELDVAVPWALFGVEGDSRRWHTDPSRMDNDLRRDLRYRRAHWIVPRVSLSWLRTDPAAARAAVSDAWEQALARLHLVPDDHLRAATTYER